MINNTAICDRLAEDIAPNIKNTFASAQQIVFIDQVEDYQLLAAGVIPGIEVVVLESDRNGIEQITEVLSQRTDISTIHLVSHGSPGCLYLGNSNLSLDTLNRYQSELQSWFNPPAFGTPLDKGGRGDLLLYGCNVAAGDAGEEFISKLHNITGAEIAASTTRVGNAAKGGNWNLEVNPTPSKVKLAFTTTARQNYTGVLMANDSQEDLIKPLVDPLIADQLDTELVPKVTTDKDDYPPGSTAKITGTDFQPGETIELQVLHTDDTPNTGGGHDPWRITDGGKDDLDGLVDGKFLTTWYVNPDDSFKSAFEVTATGLNSGEVATNTFTDGAITVNGTAFIDYNNDGTQQTGSTAAEVGLSGITVTAYNSAGTQVATATTGSGGAYTFTTSATPTTAVPLRVEFGNLPSGYVEGKSSKSVFFVDGTTSTTQNLGLLDPDRYVNGVPRLITPCYVLGSSTGSTQPAIISVLHTDSGQTPASERIDTTIGKVGSVNGLAYQKQTGDLFAGAFQKRFSDVLGTDGNGKIYRVANLNDTDNTNNTVSTFINLSDFFGANAAGAYAHTAADIKTIDAASFDAVGKVALGDVEISEDRKYIWTINLADRKLYKVQVGSNSNPTIPVNYTAGDTRTINRYDIIGNSNTPTNGGIALNQLGLNPNANIRPFALAEKDGLVYVGMVNSAQSNAAGTGAGTSADLRAYVYTFNPTTGVFSSNPVLDFKLDYARQNKVDFPTPKQSANWDPWTNTHGGAGGTDGLNFQQEGTSAKYWALRTQPILSDIDFDNNGDIIVGLRDRTGDQVGDQSKDLSGNGNYNAGSGGDILRASKTATNQWTIEASVTDTDTNLTTNPEFYKGEEYNPGVVDQYDHFETAQGGITQVPGYASIDTTALDPLVPDTGGIIGLNNTTGNQTRAIRLYANNGINKANGLGDLEYQGQVAPIEIGNRIWNDINTNGIQDAGESGINGITVNLYNAAGTQVGTTTTTNGEYYFNNANVNLNGASGLLPNTTYSIRLNTAANYNSGQPLNGKNVTLSNQGSNDELDSDAVVSDGFPRITLTTGDYGANDHSYDFGFTTTPKDYGDAPDTGTGTAAGNYQTLASDAGANHTIVNNLSIGSTVDADSGTLQNTTATADNIDGTNDEDGITSFTPLKTTDTTYSVKVNVNNTTGTNANLLGWIDFNQNGVFDTGEASNVQSVPTNSVNATQTLTWNTIPTGTKAGTTYARFRLNAGTLNSSNSAGALGNGEVEDYQIKIKNNIVTGTGSPEVINTNTTIKTTSLDDLIIAGKGEDTLTGGTGNDCFYFNETSEGVDTITDFKRGEDKIDISKILTSEVKYTGSDPFGDGYVKLVSFGAGTIVQIDFNPADVVYPKDIAFLENVTGINATDFII